MKIKTPDGFLLDAEVNLIPNSTKGVIFCHGMTVEKDEEVPFIKAAILLNKIGVSTIRFDFRAHGKSTGDQIEDFNIHDELIDVKTIYDYFIDKKVNAIGIAGASFGGAISAIFAGNNPDIIRSLLLINPTISFDKFFHPKTAWFKHRFSGLQKSIDEKGYFEKKGTYSYKLGKKFTDDLHKYNPGFSLAVFNKPLMIIHSKLDIYVDYREVESCFNSLSNPDKKLILFETGEHGFPNDPQVSQVANHITNFFQKNL